MRLSILLLALGLTLPSCGREESPGADAAEAPLLVFDTVALRIATGSDTLPLRAELAVTAEQRAMGLMERSALPADAGMLFWFQDSQPADAGFWMFRTRIPLDIAYLGPEGEIRSIREMEPCTSPDPRWCPSYPAGVEYRAALEVNRGFFERHGIEVGDRVLLPPMLAEPQS